MIILGVDPGSLRTGFGAISSDGRSQRLIEQGVLAPPRHALVAERLHYIFSGLTRVIERHQPEILAVEDLFHGTNTRSAIVLAHVRGVVLLAGAQAGLTVRSYSPATVKAQVTGYGRADKTQVALMVTRLLDLQEEETPGDCSDALSVALCDAHQHPPTLGSHHPHPQP